MLPVKFQTFNFVQAENQKSKAFVEEGGPYL